MEKRTLLAFALSLLVLLVWQQMFYKPPQKTKTKETAKTEGAAKPGAETKEKTTAQKVPEKKQIIDKNALLTPPPQKIAGKIVTVDTPNFRAEFSTKGGLLKSFKLRKYRESVEKDSPPKELVTIKDSGYYPFLTELVKNSDAAIAYAEYKVSAEKLVVRSDKKEAKLIFSWDSPKGLRVIKTFTFYPDNYLFDMKVTLENTGTESLTDALAINMFNAPYEKEQSRLNANRVVVLNKKGLEEFNEKKIRKSSPVIPAPFKWLGYENNYFITALIPLSEDGYKVSLNLLNESSHLVRTVFLTPQFLVKPGAKTDFEVRFFVGPKDLTVLKDANYDLAKSVNFGWFDIIAKPLLWFMDYIYKYVHNYGVAIIVVTVVIKILFWPLTHKSYESMKTMKKLQPKMAAIREKYKNDREKLNQELMNLYRTYKVNPVGGCLPMILQIPVFFALYRMLYGAIELRHAPFCLWINDLSAPDRLYIGINIPYLGGLPVLTILMGISMFVQQKMTPTGGDPRQEKMMLMMPVIFTVFFVNFPSGLVLYWLVNNILSIGQQYMINKNA